jgi:hypothetical protein
MERLHLEFVLRPFQRARFYWTSPLSSAFVAQNEVKGEQERRLNQEQGLFSKTEFLGCRGRGRVS